MTGEEKRKIVAASIGPTEHAPSRPGWPEVIVGLLVFAAVGYGGGSQLYRLGLDPVLNGLTFTALSGIAGFVGFAAAVALRVRSLEGFGIRAAPIRWLLIGVAVGLAAFVVKGFTIIAYVHLTGDNANAQAVYATGGSGGVVSLALATIMLGVVTPIGEELIFRGIVTNAFLRYGPFVGVVGSALIFALMHGINMVFPAAVVAGLATAEVFRRSGSIWPSIIVHVVFNLATVPVMVLADAA